MTPTRNASGSLIEAAGLERALHVAMQQLRCAAVHNTKSDRDHRMTCMLVTDQLSLRNTEDQRHDR